jgi:hypothetical protein
MQRTVSYKLPNYVQLNIIYNDGGSNNKGNLQSMRAKNSRTTAESLTSSTYRERSGPGRTAGRWRGAIPGDPGLSKKGTYSQYERIGQ